MGKLTPNHPEADVIEVFIKQNYFTIKMVNDWLVAIASLIGLYLLYRIYKILKREVEIFEETKK